MKSNYQKFLATCVFAMTCPPALSYVVPPAFAATQGDANYFFYNTFNEGLTYQFLIDDSMLTGLSGQQITGIRFRLAPNLGPWLTDDFIATDFEIRMGTGAEVSAMSNTFADNFVGGQTLVRDGQYTFPGDSFPNSAALNSFGPTVALDNPYTYSSGNLVVELRVNEVPQPTSQLILDAAYAFGGATNGYGTNFAARHNGFQNSTFGDIANFIITDFQSQAVPEPMSLVALSILAPLAYSRRKLKA